MGPETTGIVRTVLPGGGYRYAAQTSDGGPQVGPTCLGEYLLTDMEPGSYRTPHTTVTTDTTVTLDAEIGDGGTFRLHETNVQHAYDGRGERHDENDWSTMELLCLDLEAARWLHGTLSQYLAIREG